MIFHLASKIRAQDVSTTISRNSSFHQIYSRSHQAVKQEGQNINIVRYALFVDDISMSVR